MATANGFLDYYVAIDNRPDVTGYFANYPNPNKGRLTVTWAHAFPVGYPAGAGLTGSSNHFHSIGAVAYVTPPGATGTLAPGQTNLPTFFTNSRAPEGSRPGIRMEQGTGVFANKFVTVNHPDGPESNWTYYDNLTFGSIHNMRADAAADPAVMSAIANGQAAWQSNGDLTWTVNPNGTSPNPTRASTDIGWMYTSSQYARSTANGGGFTTRYTALFDSSVIELELVSKSAALDITNAAGTTLLASPGDRVQLGTGRTWEFTPVFSTALTTPLGSELTATFRLVDSTNANLPSGDFTFAMFVPEPATLGLLAGASVLALRRRSR
jgi:hypothetical protein